MEHIWKLYVDTKFKEIYLGHKIINLGSMSNLMGNQKKFNFMGCKTQ